MSPFLLYIARAGLYLSLFYAFYLTYIYLIKKGKIK